MDETTEPTCGKCACGKDEGLKIERPAVSEMDGVS
jgi:hypothetical protein